MISPTLAIIGTDLQRSASRGLYAEVERLAVKAGAAAAREAHLLPAGDPGLTEIGEWLCDLYRRAETLLRICRATQAGELRRATLLKRYLPGPEQPAAHVRLAL